MFKVLENNDVYENCKIKQNNNIEGKNFKCFIGNIIQPNYQHLERESYFELQSGCNIDSITHLQYQNRK